MIVSGISKGCGSSRETARTQRWVSMLSRGRPGSSGFWASESRPTKRASARVAIVIGALLVLSPITALVCNVVRLVPTSLFYGYATAANAQRVHDMLMQSVFPRMSRVRTTSQVIDMIEKAKSSL